MTRRGAFTLIEVLVSVAIIALLISIVLPSVSEARLVSKRGVCQHNLHQIGLGVEQYLQVNRDTFPFICAEPAVEYQVAQLAKRAPYIPINRGLARELSANSKVLDCPADKVTRLSKEEQAAISSGKSKLRIGGRYFESENTSYQWNTQVNGKRRDRKKMTWFDIDKKETIRPLSQMMIVFDFDQFHGGARRRNSVMYLYADGHTPIMPEKGTVFSFSSGSPGGGPKMTVGG